MNRWLLLLAGSLALAVGAGCRGTRGSETGTPFGPIITPGSGVTGQVVWLNTRGRFVVVRFPVGRLPESGERMSVYRGGLKVGEVRISGPRNEDNAVADLTAGEAAKGDVVRRE